MNGSGKIKVVGSAAAASTAGVATIGGLLYIDGHLREMASSWSALEAASCPALPCDLILKTVSGLAKQLVELAGY